MSRGKGMILCTDSIEKLCKGEKPLINPYKEEENRKNPAKTELHLGEYCYCSDKKNSITRLKDGESITIKPNSIFLFQTEETFCFPKNLAGHMSLRMGWVAKGLFMPSQTQVDPGYNNVLFGMIYNLSSEDVTIKKGEAITTLEVFKVEQSQYEYSGKMADTDFEKFVSTRIGSSLGELEKRIEDSKKELDKNIQTYHSFTGSINRIITIITVIIALSSIISTFASIKTALKDDATIYKLEYELNELVESNNQYKSALDEQTKQIAEYEERISELESRISNFDPLNSDVNSDPSKGIDN